MEQEDFVQCFLFFALIMQVILSSFQLPEVDKYAVFQGFGVVPSCVLDLGMALHELGHDYDPFTQPDVNYQQDTNLNVM